MAEAGVGEGEGSAWIEVWSDGRPQHTRVWLVIDGPAGQVRYKIPGVLAVSWVQKSSRLSPVCVLDLGGVHMEVRARVSSDTTDAATLLSELAAGELVKDKDE